MSGLDFSIFSVLKQRVILRVKMAKILHIQLHINMTEKVYGSHLGVILKLRCQRFIKLRAKVKF